MLSNELHLTGVFVQDPRSNGFTAFFAQFPNIVAEGNDEEEATKNLISIVQTAFEDQTNHVHLSQHSASQKVTTKGFNLQFS